MEVTVLPVLPVVVSFDLSAFLFSCEHYNDADVLLPDDVPEVLISVSQRNLMIVSQGHIH